jgi:hypothetical protein
VLILDDDLMPANSEAVARLVSHVQPGKIVGPFGAVLSTSHRYSERRDVASGREPVAVEVIKGRCAAMLTETVHMGAICGGTLQARFGETWYDDLCIAEDIAVSGAVAGGRYGVHLVPAGIADDWESLPEAGEALSRRGDHLARRNRICARWFK